MKKSISFLIMFALMFTMTVPISAETCNLETEKRALEKIEIKANYKENSFAYTITIKNLSNKFYVLDSFGNKYESLNNELEINPQEQAENQYRFIEGLEYRLSFFGSSNSSCENTMVYELNFQSLVENEIRNDELCNQDSNFYLCADYLYVEDSEKDFMTEWNNKSASKTGYDSGNNKNVVLVNDYQQILEETKSSTLLIRVSVAFVFVIILIVLYVIYKKNRGGK